MKLFTQEFSGNFMKTFVLFVTILLSNPLLAQGLQDGGHGSGGDEQAEYLVAVNAHWNVVSVPIVVGDYFKSTIFPTATSDAYAYNGGSYVVTDTLDNGPGYWLKFSSAQVFSLGGSLIHTDSLDLAPGWNLVGSISAPIPVSSVTVLGTTLVSPFYSFGGSGYSTASAIEPGLGYWVKSSSAGTLVLSSGSPVPAPVLDPLAKVLAELNTLTFTDASGNQRTLLFGSATKNGNEFFELPPVPPAGIFDARFASQRMVTTADEAIALASAIYPIAVRWNVTAPGDFAVLADGKEIPVHGEGSTTIARPAILSLRIGLNAELPREFHLSQNFPNPFNPTTTFRYALPVESHTSLIVYNILGEEVRTLVNEMQEAGFKAVEWNATNNSGQPVGSGVYFCRIQAGSFVQHRKMLLLK